MHVIVVFEGVTQAQHLPRHVLIGHRNSRIGNECKLLPIGRDARVLERLSYSVELIVGSDNNILILLSCQLFSAGLQRQLEKPVFVDADARHRDLPFL